MQEIRKLQIELEREREKDKRLQRAKKRNK